MKGLGMVAVGISLFLIALYFLVNYLPNKSSSVAHARICDQIKDQINDYFKKSYVKNVVIQSSGNFEPELDGGMYTVYHVSADVALDSWVTCLHVMLEDLSPIGIQLGIGDLIRQIENSKKDLHIAC